MMQKQLPLHQKKREIMKRPPQHTHPNLIIKPLKRIVLVIPARALPPQQRQPLERNIQPHGRGRSPPDQGIADEVDLPIILAPEIDAAFEDGPGGRAGVPGVGLDEPGIRRPHDLLQFPEFAEEARVAVVDFLFAAGHLWMGVGFHIPDAVWEGPAAGAGDFLLFEAPVGELDFVAEEHAAGHEVHEFEFGLDGAEAGFGYAAVGEGFDDFQAEEVVGVAFEAFVAVGRDFVLPVCFRDGGAHVVGVQASVGGGVVQAHDASVYDVLGGDGVPCHWAGYGSVAGRIDGPVDWLCLVLEQPDVVLVFVWVECDLLLLRSSWVHVLVRV